MRESTVGGAPARIVRVTFVGELGWEVYVPTEYGLGGAGPRSPTPWPAAGGLPCGYKAIDSLRAEKGYRYWGSDVTPDETPYEAGLGFCVRMDKEGGFLGRDALVGRDQPDRRLACLTLARPPPGGARQRAGPGRRAPPSAGSPRAATGHTVGASIAFAYLPAERGDRRDARWRCWSSGSGCPASSRPIRSTTRRAYGCGPEPNRGPEDAGRARAGHHGGVTVVPHTLLRPQRGGNAFETTVERLVQTIKLGRRRRPASGFPRSASSPTRCRSAGPRCARRSRRCARPATSRPAAAAAVARSSSTTRRSTAAATPARSPATWVSGSPTRWPSAGCVEPGAAALAATRDLSADERARLRTALDTCTGAAERQPPTRRGQPAAPRHRRARRLRLAAHGRRRRPAAGRSAAGGDPGAEPQHRALRRPARGRRRGDPRRRPQPRAARDGGALRRDVGPAARLPRRERSRRPGRPRPRPASTSSPRCSIHALHGFVDAGGAVQLVTDHLLAALPSRVVATFDVDQLHDYRARRPPMVFMEDHWESVEPPRLELHQVTDEAGTRLPAPHRVGAGHAVGALHRGGGGARPRLRRTAHARAHRHPDGGAAHPARTAHGARDPARPDHRLHALGRHGRGARAAPGTSSSCGSASAAWTPWAWRPASRTTSPSCPTRRRASRCSTGITRAAGLMLPDADLQAAADETRTAVDEQLRESVEGSALVTSLEQQYDASVAASELPTADELGAELERFLASQPRPDDPARLTSRRGAGARKGTVPYHCESWPVPWCVDPASWRTHEQARHAHRRGARAARRPRRGRHRARGDHRHAGPAAGQAAARPLLPGRGAGPRHRGLQLPARRRRRHEHRRRLRDVVVGDRLRRLRHDARPVDAAARPVAARHGDAHRRPRLARRLRRRRLAAADPQAADRAAGRRRHAGLRRHRAGVHRLQRHLRGRPGSRATATSPRPTSTTSTTRCSARPRRAAAAPHPQLDGRRRA